MAEDRATSVTLWVSDLDATGRFYRDFLGFEMDDPHRHFEGDDLHYDLAWGDFETGNFMMLHLCEGGNGRRTSGVQIGFSVNDLATIHARAGTCGVKVLQEPAPGPWGANAKYEDPEGNLISVTEG
jgi:catechol 2,3-dioxygenase-like lactoylglutathione lyase family enzyme